MLVGGVVDRGFFRLWREFFGGLVGDWVGKFVNFCLEIGFGEEMYGFLFIFGFLRVYF